MGVVVRTRRRRNAGSNNFLKKASIHFKLMSDLWMTILHHKKAASTINNFNTCTWLFGGNLNFLLSVGTLLSKYIIVVHNSLQYNS